MNRGGSASPAGQKASANGSFPLRGLMFFIDAGQDVVDQNLYDYIKISGLE